MLPVFDRANLETLRARVENHLRQAILGGQLKPGEKLIERELCEMMGVSRPSLREALRKLEAEKLIINVPNRGPEVVSITLSEARDIYGLRRVLESYAAHEFARLASAEEIATLGKAVKRLRTAGNKKSRDGVLKAKAEFYNTLLGGCGNSLVREVLDGLLSRVSLLRSTSLMLPDRLPKSLDEIDDLLDCIKRRDSKGAQEISRQHVLSAESAALSVFEQQMALRKNQTTKKGKSS
jgi:DNA-binding GntR family transcriptional regulator